MRFRHGCRDSSAHSHDGEGKKGEDVLGVHFDRKGGSERMGLLSCWDGLLEFEMDVGSGWCFLEDLNEGRRWWMLVDAGGVDGS